MTEKTIADVLEFAPRAEELATRLVAAGPKAAHVSASETHEIADFVHMAILALRRQYLEAIAPVADERAALADLLEYVDRNTCTHEDTHRGGAIWTICDGCGMKWADDEGGFVPHQDAPAVAAARAALAGVPVADESPMAKMAEALREKARQEQRAYQDRRDQATEWGPMPAGTEADDPSALAALADGLESIVGNENAKLAAVIIRRMASAPVAGMKPLEPEFANVLGDNFDSLMVRIPSESGPVAGEAQNSDSRYAAKSSTCDAAPQASEPVRDAVDVALPLLPKGHARNSDVHPDSYAYDKWQLADYARAAILADRQRGADPVIGHITVKGKGRSSVDLDASHADLPEGEYVLRAALSAQPDTEPLSNPKQFPLTGAENIRAGAPYDDPAFEALCREHGIWGTALSALCAVFWRQAGQQRAAGDERTAFEATYQADYDDPGAACEREHFGKGYRAGLAAQPADKPAISSPSSAGNPCPAPVPAYPETGNSHTDGGAVYG